jgi:septum formation protein
MKVAPLVLASASPRRKALLEQIAVFPDEIVSAGIEEAPLKGETPRDHAARLATEKIEKIAPDHPMKFVLGADTVVACGRRILPKAQDEETARRCLALLSGRAHRVYTGIALFTPDQNILTRIVETRVKVRRLSAPMIDDSMSPAANGAARRAATPFRGCSPGM